MPTISEQARDIERQFGSTRRAWDELIQARGEREGAVSPVFEGMDPGTLAKLDRYLQVKNSAQQFTPVIGAADAVGNIGYDALKSSGALPAVAALLKRVPGMGELADLGAPGPTTSPPNFWENSAATIGGLMDALRGR